MKNYGLEIGQCQVIISGDRLTLKVLVDWGRAISAQIFHVFLCHRRPSSFSGDRHDHEVASMSVAQVVPDPKVEAHLKGIVRQGLKLRALPLGSAFMWSRSLKVPNMETLS